MESLNVLGVDTVHGFRTVELFEGDITTIGFRADVIVISAFAGSYAPLPGTLIEALHRVHRIDVGQHASRPDLDLVDALGIWISAPLSPRIPYQRILAVELRGTGHPLGEALDNVFAALQLLSAKQIGTRVVVLPLLGAGSQHLAADTMARELVQRAKTYLEQSPTTNRLVFVELNHQRAADVSAAIDTVLGRHRVTLPHEQLVSALIQDVTNKLRYAESLFEPDCQTVRDDWVRLLQKPEVRAVEFGVNSRKLVELMLARLAVPQQQLAQRIRSLEQRGTVAPWICAYMHVLRQLGNESAHDNSQTEKRQPPVIAPGDLTAGLFCVQRLLAFWSLQRADAT